MGENDQSRTQLVWQRLTDQDPRSVKLQVLTAAGFVLASYLFFFVLTQGSAGTGHEGGNIRADGEKHTAPPELGGKRGENQPQDSLASDIGRVLRGTDESGRRATLAKFTETEYEAFFGRLEKLSSGIKTEIESGGGMKARFELRYRALEEAVTTILERDSSVFTSNRKLASQWQDVKDVSADVYRITYHPAAQAYSAFPGIHRTWYTELVKNIYPGGEGPNEYPYIEHQEAITVAKKRLFDQRLTVGEHEDVVAADRFLQYANVAVEKAHQSMDAFHDALKTVARKNEIVKEAIRHRRITPRAESAGPGLIGAFLADYDMPTILGYGPRGPRETITQPMDGLIITQYLGDPGDNWIFVDFLHNLTRPERPHDINSDRLDMRHIDKPHTDESHVEKPSADRNRIDKGRVNELLDQKKLGEPDWLGGEPSSGGSRSGGDKRSQKDQERKTKPRTGGDRP